jgi:hypothetical protein
MHRAKLKLNMYNIFAIFKPSIPQGTSHLCSVVKEVSVNDLAKGSKFCTRLLPCNLSLLFTLR